jgi:glycosyltransferase involved in cell wall biosynthesis
MRPKISVVINTLNEEKNLPYALRSVHAWADEIIVVDMYSDDRTVEIAREYGAKVFFHERIAAFDGARQFAIEQASNDWVLVLDADEMIPEPLSRILIEIVGKDKADVVLIPWLNYLLGEPLLHTGWGPNQDKHYRLFKKMKLTLSSTIHSVMKPHDDARVYELPYKSSIAIVHFNYVNTTQFMEKLNRYTSVEAQQAFERGERSSVRSALWMMFKEFANRYIRKQGFRDGWRGFYLSLSMSFYRMTIFMKLKEIDVLGDADQIIASYHREADKLLKGYDGAIYD